MGVNIYGVAQIGKRHVAVCTNVSDSCTYFSAWTPVHPIFLSVTIISCVSSNQVLGSCSRTWLKLYLGEE